MKTIEVVASADSYISSQFNTTNYGSNTSLVVGKNASGEFRAPVMFDLSGISGIEQIPLARIRFRVSNVLGTGDLALRWRRSANRTWVEGETTWEEYATGLSWPSPGGHILSQGSDEFTVASLGTYEVSIPAAGVLTDYGLYDATYWWLMTEQADLKYGYLYSREYGTVAYRPTLILGYYGEDVPGYPGRYGRVAGRSPYAQGETFGGRTRVSGPRR